MLLVACGGPTSPIEITVVVTAVPTDTATPPPFATNTPTPTATAIPTNTPEPTPTPDAGETFLDCFDNTASYDFFPVNSNPCLRGVVVHTPHYTPDGRWHCAPLQFAIVSRLGDKNTPPWVNCQVRLFENDLTKNIINFDIDAVNGEFGMSQFVTFQPNECYIVKQTGFVQGAGQMNNIGLVAQLHTTDGDTVELRRQVFADSGYRVLDEKYEIFWIISTNRPRPAAQVEIFVRQSFADFDGNVEVWTFEVTTAPDLYCTLDAAIRW